MMARAPGVGPKVALRIVNELKDKALPIPAGAASIPSQTGHGTDTVRREASPASDAISALINLGYAPIQANAAISAVLAKAGDSPRTEELIRLGLKELAR
jgi:holliday junction DNA helicase RuvA